MNILYLDCGMGAAGDMLASALLELLDDKEAFIAKLNALGLPGVSFVPETVSKCGIVGTHLRVVVNGQEETASPHEHTHEHIHEHEHKHEHSHEHIYEHEHPHAHEHEHDHEHVHEHTHEHEHEHHHTHEHHSMADIEKIVDGMPLSKTVNRNVLDVYRLIAEAEGHAHGKPVSEIHFHEVGTMDAIADVTAVSLLMEELNVDKVFASPVHVGCGHVHCAHGILPVPAPATAYILQGVPVYGGRIQGELCTPTGAALLKKYVTSFGEMPTMSVKKIGYGMGNKDFEAANCIRAMLAEMPEQGDMIVELCCNLDDMTAEQIGFAMERLFWAGALDVFTVPLGMKKSRPGVMLCTICHESDKATMLQLIFQHTTTLGIRENYSRRHTLEREIKSYHTSCGEVRVKHAAGYGVTKDKIEYEDLARIAREKNISIAEAAKIVQDVMK